MKSKKIGFPFFRQQKKLKREKSKKEQKKSENFQEDAHT